MNRAGRPKSTGRWFRLYAAAMRSPKVETLSDSDFRLWVRLLAIASENDGKIPGDEGLKAVLRARLDHLKKALMRLVTGGLIEPSEDGYRPHDWDDWQYKSDTSTDRVRDHREKRNVSKHQNETPSETEAESEKIPVAKATGAKARSATLFGLPEKPPDDPLKKRSFDLGKKIIPNGRSGEIVAQLFKKKGGWDRAYAALVSAQDAADPERYCRGIINSRKVDEDWEARVASGAAM